VYDVLRQLHVNYKLGIISNFGIPEMIEDLLERFQLKRFLDTVVISAETKIRKPSPEIFKKTLRILKTDPSNAVFVGDRLDMDIKGAKNIGMKTVLIKRRPLVDTETKPDITILRFNDLLLALEKLASLKNKKMI
jgi:putative hydrolase of the HAD superfamily